MTRSTLSSSLGLAGLITAAAIAAPGVTIAVDWFTIDSGGAFTMTGSTPTQQFEIESSIGQHDAGLPMIGTVGPQTFEVVGGFRAAPGGQPEWIGPNNGSFFTSSNWGDLDVPGPGDVVVIDSPSSFPYAISFTGAQNAISDRLIVRGGDDVRFDLANLDYQLIGGSEVAPSLVIDSPASNLPTTLRVVNTGAIPHGVVAQDISIGESVNSVAQLTLDDDNTTLTSSGTLWIGRRGEGTLSALRGDINTDGAVVFGDEPNSWGKAVIQSVGTQEARWDHAGDNFIVGKSGRGELTILGGAKLYTSIVAPPQGNALLAVAAMAGSQGTVKIDGNGSLWEESDADMKVGGLGIGQVEVTNGGVLRVPGVTVNTGSFLSGNVQGTVSFVAGGTGTLQNFGTLSPAPLAVESNDRVAPIAMSTLIIDGDYQQIQGIGPNGRSGTARFRIDPSASGQKQDVLSVQGLADLGGGLVVTLEGGQPALNQTFPIVQSGALTNTFTAGLMPSLVTPGQPPRFVRPEYMPTNLAGQVGVTLTVAQLQNLVTIGGADPTTLAAGAPTAATTGNFNTDALIDMAVAINGTPVSAPGIVLVLLNNGDNTFTVQSTQYTVGVRPVSLCTGKLDGDNAGNTDDLACANLDSNNLTVLYSNGSNGFDTQENVVLPPGSGPRDVAAANFNLLDGNGDDLVVANSLSNTVQVFENSDLPAGGFPSSQLLAGTFNSPCAVDPADVDNDRDSILDLVVSSCGGLGGTISMFSNDGTGAFTPQTSMGVGANPIAMISTDLDLDGRPEVVTANQGDGTISILVNKTLPGGTFTFEPAANLPVGNSPVSLVAVNLDFDARNAQPDSDPDLAVVVDDIDGRGVIQVLRNDSCSPDCGEVVLAIGEVLSTSSDTLIVLAGPADANPGDDLIAVDQAANDQGLAPGGGSPNQVAVLPNLEALGCVADIAPLPAGNLLVNVEDLLAVIGSWGMCADVNNCPADLAPPGGDNTVNVQDLLAVIGAWGACP